MSNSSHKDWFGSSRAERRSTLTSADLAKVWLSLIDLRRDCVAAYADLIWTYGGLKCKFVAVTICLITTKLLCDERGESKNILGKNVCNGLGYVAFEPGATKIIVDCSGIWRKPVEHITPTEQHPTFNAEIIQRK
ncbi:hypothetical protein B0H19DRAFT_1074319 [Mycena capillaripes]|nr:hypothetical protein B0H19DRAFT_1074319 [Mycena capillaripes]